jgi:hypothetical protein
MREDLLARVLGMSVSEVAVLAQRGMPTQCWTAARAWCLLHLPEQARPPPPGSGPSWASARGFIRAAPLR